MMYTAPRAGSGLVIRRVAGLQEMIVYIYMALVLGRSAYD